MTKWCKNVLSVSGKAEQVASFIAEAHNDDNVLAFERIVPIPPQVAQREYDPWIQWAELLLWGATGKPSLATWEMLDDRVVQYTFSTEYTPPLALVLRASSKYPELGFDILWDHSTEVLFGRALICEGVVAYVASLVPLPKADSMKFSDSLLSNNLRMLLAVSSEPFGGDAAKLAFAESLGFGQAL